MSPTRPPQIQQNKQNVGSLKRKNSDASDDLRPNENGAKTSSRWSNEEVLLVVQGIKKYGKDFQAIAETIGTKSAGQVRLFFVNHKRKYDLDNALKEYYEQQQLMSQELGNGKNKPPITISDDIMEVSTEAWDCGEIEAKVNVYILRFHRSTWTMRNRTMAPSRRRRMVR